MDVFDLVAKITLDANGFSSKLNSVVSQGQSAASKLASAFKGIGTAMTVGAGAVTTAIAGITKKSLDAYADHEQLVDSVKTLYKNGANTVIKDAESAYKESGQSMNEYMNTAIMNAGSIISSLTKTTTKASESQVKAQSDALDKNLENARRAYSQQERNVERSYSDQTKAMQRQFSAQEQAFQDSVNAQVKAMERANEAKEKAMSDSFKHQEDAVSKSYSAQEKAISRSFEEQEETASKSYEKQEKELQKSLEAQEKDLSDSLEEQEKEFSKETDAEVKARQKANEKELKELSRSQDEQTKAFTKATDERIKQINREYTESYKLIDETKYKNLKAIQDRIDQLEKANDDEDAVAEQRDREEKRSDMIRKINEAKTLEDRQDAIRDYNDWKDDIAREDRQNQRKQQIDQLKDQQDAVKDAADARKDQLKEQQSDQIDAYKEERSASLDNLKNKQKDEYDARKEGLSDQLDQYKTERSDELSEMKDAHQEQLQALKDKHSDELAAQKEKDQDALKDLKQQHSDQLDSIKQAHSDQLKALQESHSDQLDALKQHDQEQVEEYQDEKGKELKDLQQAHSDQLEELNRKHSDELQALKDSNDAKLKELERYNKDAKAKISEPTTAYREATQKDYEEAARLTKMASDDMSDNVNKLGTSRESLELAYRGFSRGNYTMLDNLALGFSGTREGMQQLLDQVNQYNAEHGKATQYQIDDYADIIQAIHDYQTEIGITGTTQNEADTTIQGSLQKTKSAWQDLLTSLGSDDMDIDKAIDNFVESFTKSAQLIMPRITKILKGMIKVVDTIAPIIEEQLGPLVEQLLPPIVTALGTLTGKLIAKLPEIVKTFVSAAVTALNSAGQEMAKDHPAFGFILDNLGTVVEGIVAILAGAKIVGAVNNFIGLFTGKDNSIASAIGSLIGKFKPVGDEAEGVGDSLNNVKDAADSVTGKMTSVGDEATSMGEKFGEAKEGGGSSLLSFLNQDLSTTLETTQGKIGTFGLAISTFGASFQLATDIIQATGFDKTLEDIGGKIYDFFHKSDEAAATTSSNALAHATEIIQKGGDVSVAVSELDSAIAVASGNEKTSLQDFRDAIVQKYGEAATTSTSTAGTISKDSETASTSIDGVKKSVKNFADDNKTHTDAVKDNYDAVSKAAGDMDTNTSTSLESLKTDVGTKFGEINKKIDIGDGAKNVEGQKTSIINSLSHINTTNISKAWNGIKDGIIGIVKKIPESISNIFEGISKMQWHIPRPKVPIPSPKISRIGGDLNIPVISGWDIKWFKKAMDDAYLLNGASIFGMSRNGSLLGGGEAGQEMVVGTDKLREVVSEASGTRDIVMYLQVLQKQVNNLTDMLQQYMPELANQQIVMDSGTLVGELAPAMNSELGRIMSRSYR